MGVVVTIKGNHFRDSGNFVCRFGSIRAAPLAFISSNEVVCITPPNRGSGAGAVYVEISNNNHSFSENLAMFTYDERVELTLLNPDRGSAVQSKSVLVHGQNFLNTSDLLCRFDNTPSPAVYISATQLLCDAPVHTPGLVPVEVSLNGHDFFSTSASSTRSWLSNIDLPVGIRACWWYGRIVHGTNFPYTVDLACIFGEFQCLPHGLTKER